MRKKINTHIYARLIALVLLLAGGLTPQFAAAQGYYTITNGTVWWFNGSESMTDEQGRDPIAYDGSQCDASGSNCAEVHPHGADNVTQITERGNTYLALDITSGTGENPAVNGGTPSEPKITSKTSFDLSCMWYRTNYTGYYYQEWDGYRYYLVANSSEERLDVVRVEVNSMLTQTSTWYNWDFGAAVWETPTIEGSLVDRYYWIMLQNRQRNNHASTLDPNVWTISRHTYQRPDAIRYIGGLTQYFDTVWNSPSDWYPAGTAAVIMPVKETAHAKTIRYIMTDENDDNKPYGLQKTTDPATHASLGTGIAITDPTNHTTPVELLEYSTSTTVTADLRAQMKYLTHNSEQTVPMDYTPAYTEYNEETYRRGIHPNYRYRDTETFGSAGIGTYSTHYLWGGELHNNIPNDENDYTTVKSITFSVDNRSSRYLSVTADENDPAHATLTFHHPTSGIHTAKIIVKVVYMNGNEQRDTAELTLKFEKPTPTIEAHNGPVVHGSLFGGGRMSNVGGNTLVVVHSTDTIPTVYGGNDIAGWVQGDDGATIKLGTEYTNVNHPVHIGSVYGGGNGYYTYQHINSGFDEETQTHYNPYFMSQSTALTYQAYYFNGKVYKWNTLPQRATYLGSNEDAQALNSDNAAWDALGENDLVTDHVFTYSPYYVGRPDIVDQAETGDDGDGTIPYIKSAHITVGVPEGKDNNDNPTPFLAADGSKTWEHNDYILIDTIFGGARNAFIGVDANENENAHRAVSISFNGGTSYAVFGGNNVGGSVAKKATVFVNINDTKLVDADHLLEDTWLNGYGRDYGIRYLFGGGNQVEGAHANVTIRGGMLDTVYLGGNRASVLNPVGTVECVRGASNDAPAGHTATGHFICTNTTYPDNSTFTDPFTLLNNSTFLDNYGPGNFNPETGIYNIRSIFGGNNAADMENQTILLLHSGGISSVYGGGNAGDMNNDQLFNDGTADNQLFPNAQYNQLIKQAFDIDPSNGNMIADGWANVYGRATLPNKVGTMVASLPDSKIVCDYVFGGCRKGNVKNSAGCYLTGGIFGYVNGGNDVSGDIGSETGGCAYTVIGGNALVIGDAMGGSDGYYHCDDGTGHYDEAELFDSYSDDEDPVSYDPYNDFAGDLLPTHNNVNFYMKGGLVLGQVFGGAVHADVGFPQGNRNILLYNSATGNREERTIVPITGPKKGTVHFMMSGGRIIGNAYGGGYQSRIHGLAYLTIRGDAQIDGSFFCGNDCTGSIRSFGAYYNTNDYDNYLANNPGATEAEALEHAYSAMESSNGIKLNRQSGSWNADYSAYLRIKDTPRIKCVYGSGNGAYNYDGERPEYESITYCPAPDGEELRPLQSSTFIDINTSGPHHTKTITVNGENVTVPVGIDTVFGGGNGIGVEDRVLVLLNNTDQTVHAVHTIFGGNNRDNMENVVPDIRLTQGTVNTVFGGSNNGAMKASWEFQDVHCETVKNVSTHVVVESPYVTVVDTIFGGNRMSDIEGTSFVEVKNTTGDGVDYIFGGNDISGNIGGNTRIDVSGGVVHNLFGGSNGRYDFVAIGDNQYLVYPFRTVVTGDTAIYVTRDTVIDNNPTTYQLKVGSRLIAIAGRPDVDSTSVNLWGGSVGVPNNPAGGVYGGGAMADCRTTSVVVNDTVNGTDGNITVKGSVYGGGMGDYEDLNARDLQGNRYGNITGNTHVHLYHANAITSAKAYGGGRGGDVMNTYINTYSGWDTPFDYLYGGCWGSDVIGSTHLDFKGINLVRNLFGGNDFSGDVYRAEIKIHSGRFLNIYGAGNGDYPATDYTTGNYASNRVYRPNAEYVDLTFNNGTVDSNLYGGGKLGTTFRYKRSSSTRGYLYDANGHKIPDTTLTLAQVIAQGHTDPKDYSHIVVNIHDGEFGNNIFAGAHGYGSFRINQSRKAAELEYKAANPSATDEEIAAVGDAVVAELKEPLVYGLKVLNMDGGLVRESVYGGSESVNDGYPAECKKDNTYQNYTRSGYTAYLTSATSSRRPSSIMNLTGGDIRGNVYGTGYIGATYGSAFVNMGNDAIDSCEAYTFTYPFHATNNAKSLTIDRDGTYATFKPGDESGISPQLGSSNLLIDHSVYAGANWGSASGVADFTKKDGFVGGISSIHIDGKGYNTDNSGMNNLPLMNIQKSVFGSGTSVNGGDLRSDITIRNYGAMDECHPTRELESVQRSDTLHFHKDAILFTGASDATSSLTSEPYSLKTDRQVAFRGYNVMEFEAPISGINKLYVYEEDLNQGALQLVSKETLNQVEIPVGGDPCGSADICEQEYVVDPEVSSKQHTLLIINNGTEVNLWNDDESKYGYIYGHSYVAAPKGSGPTITAAPNYSTVQANITHYDWDEGMSGFVLSCKDSNKYTTTGNAVQDILWTDYNNLSNTDKTHSEFPYENTIRGENVNREWELEGYHTREITIYAHSNPSKLPERNKAVTLVSDGGVSRQLAVADAILTMPTAEEGHFYRLEPSSIVLTSENDAVNLVDSTWMTDKRIDQIDGTSNEAWITSSLTNNLAVKTGPYDIQDKPANTFGLVMMPYNVDGSGGGFVYNSTDGYTMPSDATGRTQNMIITGNSYVNSVATYSSPVIAASSMLQSPRMRFLLTYDPTFYTTFLGDVSFILDECVLDNNGKPVVVSQTHVKVRISTIIDEFKPITTTVLAMYNEGRTNTFTHKVVLPATLEENLSLYLQEVRWEPTTGNGGEELNSYRFYLTGDEATITGAPALVNNLFALNIIPSDNVSSDVASNVGWAHIKDSNINLYNLKENPSHTAPSRYSDSTGSQTPATIDLTNGGTSNGIEIGTLNGRGTAVLNVQLTFDGERTYPKIDGQGYVGKAVLTLASNLGGEMSTFPLTIYVKTRDHGDTIYLATAESVTNGTTAVSPYYENHTYQTNIVSDDQAIRLAEMAKIGKSPNYYVRSFQDALSSKVYQEGDVIAIIDKVEVNGGMGLTISGGDGPAIEVVRYDGHHHEMPGEAGIYRGPLIEVSGENSSFTASNIDFIGSAGAIIMDSRVARDNSTRVWVNTATPDDKFADTNRAFAPIIVAKDNVTVSLKNGTSVEHNWNAYGSEADQLDANGLPADPTMMGAISLTNGATLKLSSNVTIAHNLSHTFVGDNPDPSNSAYDKVHPFNGAVYIDGGHMVLPEAKNTTAIDITTNYLVNPHIHDNPTTVKWWKNRIIDDKLVRWEFDEDAVSNWQKANVFLTRTASTANGADPDMDDNQTDVITLTGKPSSATRISVRKWFPGETVRDTIRIGVSGSSNFTVLSQAYKNTNFLSDDGFRVFYNSKVNNNNIYLFRCATFKHQVNNVDLPIAGSYKGKDVLHYGILAANTCPTGGDSIIYNIQGGFAPYTYTWSMYNNTNDAYDNLMREYTTPYNNSRITYELNNNDNAEYYLSSIADTLYTPSVYMPHSASTLTAKLKVTAVDATEVCTLQKELEITLHKVAAISDIPGDNHSRWQPVTSPNNGWADTNSYVEATRVTAVGDRYYKAIVITPKVSYDPTQGAIAAGTYGDNNTYQLYQYNEETNSGNSLTNVLFCEGDIIRLKTEPKAGSGAEFLMWSFAPFNDNPATYVVPSHDDDVIAYYAGTKYWSDTIDTPAEAGVVNAAGYYYTGRPAAAAEYNLFAGQDPVTETMAGYVTTYNGDVHIYNENGLAWFISIVNGLNGYQSRPFYFNNVYLHKKQVQKIENGNPVYEDDGVTPVMVDSPYDMQKFLWSPVGTRQYGFRGRLFGVGLGDTDTEPLTDSRVVIRNIIVNEPNMNYAGFFGFLDSATCKSVALENIFVRGGQYVGGLAAQSTNAVIDNCAVSGTAAMLVTNYVSGGMVGDATESVIKNSLSDANYTGNAVFSGGIAGKGESVELSNNVTGDNPYVNGLYVGGVIGSVDGSDSNPEEEDCLISDLQARITGTTASNDAETYTVRVTWSTNADNVLVGYCQGESWYETADNTDIWSTASGGSATINIPISADTSIHGYTIAVKAICSDNVINMLTTYVSVETYTTCPDYWIEVTVDDGILYVQWGDENETETEEGLTIGYCAGTNWNTSNAVTTSVSSIANDRETSFQLATPYATSYIVGLYSPCSGRWVYATVEPEPGCPSYSIVEATYSAAEVGRPGNTVTLKWRNTSNYAENSVNVGIRPQLDGSTYQMTTVSANNNAGNDGISSYVFDIDNLIGTYPNCTTYTVIIQSATCENNTATATVDISNTNTCPSYAIQATYNDGTDQTNGNQPSVTMTWTPSFQLPAADNLTLGICAGSTWSDGSGSSTVEYTHTDNSYTFTSLPSLGNETTYTVSLKSGCSGQIFTQTVSTVSNNGNTGGKRGRKSVGGGRSVIANNYVRINGNGKSQRIGGIAGRSSNTDIMNNYVYGTVGGIETGGSVTAMMERGTRAVNNYSAHGTANRNVGQQSGGMISNISGFDGKGNQVILDHKIDGVDNLTRVLNRWVRENNTNGGEYKTWRSDLDDVNNGYPIFGTPDMIPVVTDKYYDGCDEVVFEGITYTRDTVITTSVVDSVEMVDSTITATIRLHYGKRTLVNDTVQYGSDYYGYGFSLSADELRMLDQTIGTEGRATIVLNDTLATAYGCDSIVTLTLTFTGTKPQPTVETEFTVKVYPNPTADVVNVEADEMSHVEVFDNEGRRLQDYNAYGNNKLTIDMSPYVSGVYFLRVHSPKGVILQKVIKHR